MSAPFDTRFATCDRCAADDIVATVGAAAVCRWCMEDAIIAIKYPHSVTMREAATKEAEEKRKEAAHAG